MFKGPPFLRETCGRAAPISTNSRTPGVTYVSSLREECAEKAARAVPSMTTGVRSRGLRLTTRDLGILQCDTARGRWWESTGNLSLRHYHAMRHRAARAVGAACIRAKLRATQRRRFDRPARSNDRRGLGPRA